MDLRRLLQVHTRWILRSNSPSTGGVGWRNSRRLFDGCRTQAEQHTARVAGGFVHCSCGATQCRRKSNEQNLQQLVPCVVRPGVRQPSKSLLEFLHPTPPVLGESTSESILCEPAIASSNPYAIPLPLWGGLAIWAAFGGKAEISHFRKSAQPRSIAPGWLSATASPRCNLNAASSTQARSMARFASVANSVHGHAPSSLALHPSIFTTAVSGGRARSSGTMRRIWSSV